jgi:uncharacterized protein
MRHIMSADDEPLVFRPGGISYLRIPAEDPRPTAVFYEAVFGWKLGGDPDRPSFEDGSGHVIGHFVTGEAIAGEAGVRPYVYVDDLDETLAKVAAHGGEIVTAPYPEGGSVGGRVPRPRRERGRDVAARPAGLTGSYGAADRAAPRR